MIHRVFIFEKMEDVDGHNVNHMLWLSHSPDLNPAGHMADFGAMCSTALHHHVLWKNSVHLSSIISVTCITNAKEHLVPCLQK